jgi:hypothetical protein
MVFVLIHGLVYCQQTGYPALEVLDAYYVDLCDAEAREELERMSEMLRAAGGIRVEVHSLENTNIPMNGVPYNYMS